MSLVPPASVGVMGAMPAAPLVDPADAPRFEQALVDNPRDRVALDGLIALATNGQNWERVVRFSSAIFFFAKKPKSGVVKKGQVHHVPYLVQRVKVNRLDKSLLAAAGLEAPGRAPEVAH